MDSEITLRPRSLRKGERTMRRTMPLPASEWQRLDELAAQHAQIVKRHITAQDIIRAYIRDGLEGANTNRTLAESELYAEIRAVMDRYGPELLKTIGRIAIPESA